MTEPDAILTPIAVCAICREPVKTAKDAIVTASSVIHVACSERSAAIA